MPCRQPSTRTTVAASRANTNADAEPLDVDHVRPLWSLDDTERAELRWWMPSNLQLLCGTCHKAKTAAEAAERAALRRGERLAGVDVEQLVLL